MCLLLAASGLVALPGLTAAASDRSAARVPGVPQDPSVLFTEDFENRANPAAEQALTAYTGISGQTYSGDPFWVSAPNCNGFILNYDNTANPADCTVIQPQAEPHSRLRSLVYAMGQVNGTTPPNTNSALAEYTEGSPPAGEEIQFQTANPIPIPAGGNRYLSAKVTAGAVNCAIAAPPLLQFIAVNGPTELPIGGSINVCTAAGQDYTVPDPRGGTVTVHAGEFVTPNAVLYPGSTLGLRVRNKQPTGNGNDGALDDIEIVDSTPTLDKSFSPAEIGEAQTSTLTFTVTNTSELAGKAGWSFTDTLPSGMKVASPSNASTTCANGKVTAVAGTGTVTVTGDLKNGDTSCTVSVDVKAPIGTYTNGPDNTDEKGLNPPQPSDLVVKPQVDLKIAKGFSPKNYQPGKPLNYTVIVSNAGPSTATGVQVVDDVPLENVTWTCAGSGGATCTASGSGDLNDSATIPAGGKVTYTITGVPADGTVGDLPNTATATRPEDVVDPQCDPDCSSKVVTPGRPSLKIVKTAKPAGPAVLEAGDRITYTFVVTNTGAEPLLGVEIEDKPFSGTGTPPKVICPPAINPLDPGETVTCHATYKLTQADVDAGGVTNTAAASGQTPRGLPDISPPSPTNVIVKPDPSVKLVKRAEPATFTAAGQKISFTLTATNTGNVTLKNVKIHDIPTSGNITIRCPKKAKRGLAPGRKLTCAGTYTTTQKDVKRGKIINSAYVDGDTPDGGTVGPHTHKAAKSKAKVGYGRCRATTSSAAARLSCRPAESA
ncbi:hypothetical protein GCM10010468_45290 [Actinocorallia longicatena]|uniref:Repeat protein (TIGR01451 family) n=1 Tax=Actinocorallia longicatena TaxID=111803 RepID=A0ABP6QGJ3_9ACTN